MYSYPGVLTARFFGIPLSQPVAEVAGLFTRKASRHFEVGGGEAPSKGRKDLPSTKGEERRIVLPYLFCIRPSRSLPGQARRPLPSPFTMPRAGGSRRFRDARVSCARPG